jgi:hypothetical protein
MLQAAPTDTWTRLFFTRSHLFGCRANQHKPPIDLFIGSECFGRFRGCIFNGAVHLFLALALHYKAFKKNV